MKLAACYTVFDGCELLIKAIETIGQHVDMVVICWQTESFNGNPIHPRDLAIIQALSWWESAFFPVEVITFVPNLLLNAKQNERLKHNRMIARAREMGATHFLMGATDHFYIPEQFERIKGLVESADLDASFTQMYTYYKHPTWQITPREEYQMPFICKLYPHTVIDRVKRFPVYVDPSVQMNTCQKWISFGTEIMMHHYSLVRHDITEKFKNAASPWTVEQIERFTRDWNGYSLEENPGIEYFGGRKIKVVPDYFGLSSIFESSE